jgi:hypothetical protein
VEGRFITRVDWNTYSGELNEATGFRGWESDDDTLSNYNLDLIYPYQDDSDDDTLSTFDLDLLYPDEDMALTQAAIDQLTAAAQDNTDALVLGMRNLVAQRKLENIPICSGESNCPLVIEEWFKMAERTARLAGWNNKGYYFFRRN